MYIYTSIYGCNRNMLNDGTLIIIGRSWLQQFPWPPTAANSHTYTSQPSGQGWPPVAISLSSGGARATNPSLVPRQVLIQSLTVESLEGGHVGNCHNQLNYKQPQPISVSINEHIWILKPSYYTPMYLF